MKKTLIALAAIAATGASFAQVSLTGEFAWGYVASSANGEEKSGGGIDTSQVAFSAKEDLGGGMSIAYKATINLGEYGNSVQGKTVADDQSLTLVTPFGGLSLLTYKPGTWVMGAAGSGTWYGLDGRNLGARAARDGYALTVPVMDGLTVTGAFTEPAGTTGEGEGNAGQAKQGIYNLSGKYANGPMVLQAGYLSFSNSGATDATTDNVTRLGATYDLGIAKAGAAIQMAKLSGGGTDNETALALTAPLAANLSIAATYAIRDTKVSDTSALFGASGTRNGYQLQAQYNLSKRTYVIGSYGAWTGQTVTAASAESWAVLQKDDAKTGGKAGTIQKTDAKAQTIVNHTKDSSLTAITLVHDF